jgi:hypothetical protein
MKTSSILATAVITIICFTCCIKSKTPGGAVPETVNIVSTWYVEYYVAANIAAASSSRRDTTYAKHNDTWTPKGDSLYTDFWYTTKLDQTKSPPVFSESDTIEIKTTYGLKYTGQKIIAQGKNKADTIDIINLTNTQLQIHQTVNPGLGYNDLYINLKR